jgi:hypothetical protein
MYILYGRDSGRNIRNWPRPGNPGEDEGGRPFLNDSAEVLLMREAELKERKEAQDDCEPGEGQGFHPE